MHAFGGIVVRSRVALRPSPRSEVAFSGFGDALSDASAVERTRVNSEAANYSLPSVPGTRSEAIMAYILLMRSAMGEDTRNAGYYKTRAAEAAYKFRNASISNILATARDLTKTAPRTNQVASSLEAATRPRAASADKPIRKRSTQTDRYVAPSSDDVPTSTAPGAAELFDTYKVPILAGATMLAAAVAYALWPRRAAA